MARNVLAVAAQRNGLQYHEERLILQSRHQLVAHQDPFWRRHCLIPRLAFVGFASERFDLQSDRCKSAEPSQIRAIRDLIRQVLHIRHGC